MCAKLFRKISREWKMYKIFRRAIHDKHSQPGNATRHSELMKYQAYAKLSFSDTEIQSRKCVKNDNKYTTTL